MLPRLQAETIVCSHPPWRPGYELSMLHARELLSVCYRLTLLMLQYSLREGVFVSLRQSAMFVLVLTQGAQSLGQHKVLLQGLQGTPQ